MTRVQGSTVRTPNFNGPKERIALAWWIRAFSGSPSFVAVMQSAGPAAPPRPDPIPAAESFVAPGESFPTKDVFLIGDSNRIRIEGSSVTSFHGTRSPMIEELAPNGSITPLLHRLSCKASAVQTGTSQMPVSRTCLGKSFPKDSIAVAQQVARELVKGKGLPQLLSVHSAGRWPSH